MSGHIDVCTTSRVSGWATAEGGPAVLDILVDGKVHAQVTCDFAHPKFASNPLSDNTGFAFRFLEPLGTDVLVAVNHSNGEHLVGSPCNPRRHEGFLDHCSTSRVVGWAVEDGRPALICIFVNDEKVADLECSVIREGIEDRGLPLTSGFDARFPRPIMAPDEIAVRFSDGTPLAHSPLRPIDQSLGHLDSCTSSRVVGWGLEGGKPAVLDVLINDQLVGQAQCDRSRPDLETCGFPPGCGFAFLLPRDASTSDEISVRFHNGGHIDRSPRRPAADYSNTISIADGGEQPAQDALVPGDPGANANTSSFRFDVDLISRARRHDLFALLEIKESLLDQLSVPDAFEFYRSIVLPRGCEALAERRLRSMSESTADLFTSLYPIYPAGEPFCMNPAQVIGEGCIRRLHGVARRIFLGRIAEARVRGRSAFIEVGDLALLDYQGDELSRLDDRLQFDPSVFHVHGDQVCILMPGAADVLTIERAFTLLGPHTDAFGHWVWEYLPKYLAASMAGGLSDMPVLIDAVSGGDMPPNHRRLLELVMPKDAEIIELPPLAVANVKQLYCAPAQMHMPVLERMNARFRWDYLGSPPSRMASIMREMARRVSASIPTEGPLYSRIYLARRGNKHRKLTNHPVIEAIASARGFFVMYPEDLDIVEQARIVRNARFILGPEGSAFFLTFFSSPGTKVCILDHPYIGGLPLLTAPLSEIGVQTTIFTGAVVQVNKEWRHCSDYQIDEKAFARFLDDWLTGDRA